MTIDETSNQVKLALAKIKMLQALSENAIRSKDYKQAVLYAQEAADIAAHEAPQTEYIQCLAFLAHSHQLNGDFERALSSHQLFHQQSIQLLMNLEDKEKWEQTLNTIHASAVRPDLNKEVGEESEREILMLGLTREDETIRTIWAELIKTISHEFRTPLTIINTSINLLNNHYNQLSEQKRLNHFKNISDSISNLILMLDEISKVDVIHSKAIEVNPGIYTFLEVCQAFKKFLMYQERVDCMIDPKIRSDKRVILDLSHVFQIIDPIIKNALIYSEDRVELMLTMETSALSEQLVILIEDKGVGIEEKELSRIYEMFYRSPRSEFHRGLGLGLYISKRLALALRGELEIVSGGVDQGTLVKISLPIRH